MKTIVEINNNNYGSTGTIMNNIASYARGKGFKVYTACKNSKEANKHHYDDQIYIGIWLDRVISEQLAYYTGLKNHFNISNTKLFINKLNKIKPDLIHIHNLHDTYLNINMFFKWIKQNNIPVVYTLHDQWPFTGQCTCFELEDCEKWKNICDNCPQIHKYPDSKVDKSKKLFLEKKYLFESLDNITFVSPSNWEKGLLKYSYLKDKKCIVINNGINLDKFKPIQSNFREKYHLHGKHILLGVATSWGKRKGLDVFIKLSKDLDKHYQIVLVGTNDEIDKILPVNIISIHKTFNQNELVEIYSEADLFVNPTREDNFPTVNIEALACGTPVITYKTGGSPEIIDDNCGVEINKNDYKSLLTNIKDIVETNKFAKENCLKRARQFNMNDKFSEYVKLYLELLMH